MPLLIVADLKARFAQEDARIVELVGRLGAKRWSLIAQELPGRIGKQCRERCAISSLHPRSLFEERRTQCQPIAALNSSAGCAAFYAPSGWLLMWGCASTGGATT